MMQRISPDNHSTPKAWGFGLYHNHREPHLLYLVSLYFAMFISITLLSPRHSVHLRTSHRFVGRGALRILVLEGIGYAIGRSGMEIMSHRPERLEAGAAGAAMGLTPGMRRGGGGFYTEFRLEMGVRERERVGGVWGGWMGR